ncbi:7786_t:CDS:2 [Funneliformis geosporum]|nr:7786_t:CDS:2 [Funneliformis geosporum]
MKTYSFGPHLIRSTPIRVVQRYRDLNPDEVTDLFLNAQKIGQVVEREYQGTSLTLTIQASKKIIIYILYLYVFIKLPKSIIQDGPEAGQTVPHCHLHIIPRKVGDWANNDDIYEDIDKSTRVDNEERPPRSFEEMEKEANFLRSFFQSDDINYN